MTDDAPRIGDPDQYRATFLLSNRRITERYENDYLIHHFRGGLHFDGNDDDALAIGLIEGWRVDLGEGLNSGRSVIDAADEEDGELPGYCSAVLSMKTEHFKDSLLVNGIGDLLIIHKVHIDEAHRRHRLGLLFVAKAIREMGGGCAAVVIKPFPYEDAKPTPEAKAKLRDYWSQLNFRRIGKTSYYMHDTAFKLPRPEEILAAQSHKEKPCPTSS